MDVDTFIAWALRQPGTTRYELFAGEVLAMAPERVIDAECKFLACQALTEAMRKAGLGCKAYVDGPLVRIDRDTAYQPDALMRCGAPIDPHAIEVSDPVIVVEVASPSTAALDEGEKFAGYFSLPSVRHYLRAIPAQRVLIHHGRATAGGPIGSAILRDGVVVLDPPGLAVPVAAFFP